MVKGDICCGLIFEMDVPAESPEKHNNYLSFGLKTGKLLKNVPLVEKHNNCKNA